MKSVSLFIILLFVTISCFSQKSLNRLFESSKGKWQLPLKRILFVADNEKLKHMTVNMFDSTLRLITDSAYNVYSVHDAEVTAIFEVGGEYSVITKSGDYFISYQRLSQPSFVKGEVLEAGQFIATLVNRADSQFSLELSLTKQGNELDISKWFNWQNAAIIGSVK
jgi:hypothetical protein